jgi:hypothetical protein
MSTCPAHGVPGGRTRRDRWRFESGAGRLDAPPTTTVGTPDEWHRAGFRGPDPGVGHEMVTFPLLTGSRCSVNTQRTGPSADRE